MALDITHAVIHSFTKDAKSTIIKEIVKKDILLDKKLPAVISLISGVSNLLGKPGNVVAYGQFGNDMRQGPFPTKFNEYSENLLDADSFLALSHLVVDELATQAQAESLATGGHILVAQYLSETAPFTLIAMIKQRGGVTLDENYIPIEITEIDLTKVYQAARININRYKEVLALPAKKDDAEEEEKNIDRTYLCFIGQSKNNQASQYFINALGCIKGISSSRATSSVIKGIESFFSSNELKKYKARARDAVVSYLQNQLKSEKDATLDDINHVACSCVSAADRSFVEPLKDYLNSDKCKIPSQFPIHESTLKKKIRIKADAGKWAIQFEQHILGTSSDSILCYNKENQSLTLNELPDSLVESIENEISLRTQTET